METFPDWKFIFGIWKSLLQRFTVLGHFEIEMGILVDKDVKFDKITELFLLISW